MTIARFGSGSPSPVADQHHAEGFLNRIRVGSAVLAIRIFAPTSGPERRRGPQLLSPNAERESDVVLDAGAGPRLVHPGALVSSITTFMPSSGVERGAEPPCPSADDDESADRLCVDRGIQAEAVGGPV